MYTYLRSNKKITIILCYTFIGCFSLRTIILFFFLCIGLCLSPWYNESERKRVNNWNPMSSVHWKESQSSFIFFTVSFYCVHCYKQIAEALVIFFNVHGYFLQTIFKFLIGIKLYSHFFFHKNLWLFSGFKKKSYIPLGISLYLIHIAYCKAQFKIVYTYISFVFMPLDLCVLWS